MNNAYKSAFPQQKGPDGHGLTKREYFAIHAPNEVPVWFEGHLPNKPAEPMHWKDMPEGDDRNEVYQWHTDGSWDLPERLRWYQDAWTEYNKQMVQYNKEVARVREFQWRVYFADKLLKHLEK